MWFKEHLVQQYHFTAGKTEARRTGSESRSHCELVAEWELEAGAGCAPLSMAPSFSVPAAPSPPAARPSGNPLCLIRSCEDGNVCAFTGVTMSAPRWKRLKGRPAVLAVSPRQGAVRLQSERLRCRRARCFCREPLSTCVAAVGRISCLLGTYLVPGVG